MIPLEMRMAECMKIFVMKFMLETVSSTLFTERGVFVTNSRLGDCTDI